MYFCGISYFFLFFISYFVWLGPFSFLLGESDQRFVNLFIFSKYQLLVLLILSLKKYSLFYLFPIWSLLFPSFCLLWVLLVLFFLILLGGRLGCLKFFLFLEEGLYHYTSPYQNCFCYICRFVKLYFHFCMCLANSMISSLISSSTHLFFNSMLFSLGIYQPGAALLARSADKESSCDAGDLGSIPGLGRSPGEGKGYPLQYSGLEN